MGRQAHHSNNYGGKRPGAGRPRGSTGKHRKLIARALEMADKAKIHPLEYLLSVLEDNEAPRKDKIQAATASLPYVMTRLASGEISINHSLSDESEEQLVNRLLSAQNQLVQLGLSVIESEAVNE